MSTPTKNFTVLYIVGWCRSGSTILGNVLNEVDDCFHAGELHYLWKNSLDEGTNAECGCHAHVAACPVWFEVMKRAAGRKQSWDSYARAMVQLQRHVRTRHTWRILRARQLSVPLSVYRDELVRTYRNIADHTGARVIIDGSKFASEAALLAQHSSIDVRVLHLLRDPCAVAYSWSTPKMYIDQMSALRSTGYWIGFNMAADALRAHTPRTSLRLHYSSFLKDPREATDCVLDLLRKSRDLNPVRERHVELGRNHTVSGNPDRLHQGPIRIEGDDEAKSASVPVATRYALRAMTYPLIHRYGESESRQNPRAA